MTTWWGHVIHFRLCVCWCRESNLLEAGRFRGEFEYLRKRIMWKNIFDLIFDSKTIQLRKHNVFKRGVAFYEEMGVCVGERCEGICSLFDLFLRSVLYLKWFIGKALLGQPDGIFSEGFLCCKKPVFSDTFIIIYIRFCNLGLRLIIAFIIFHTIESDTIDMINCLSINKITFIRLSYFFWTRIIRYMKIMNNICIICNSLWNWLWNYEINKNFETN